MLVCALDPLVFQFGYSSRGFLNLPYSSSACKLSQTWSPLRVFGWLVFVLLLRVFHFHFLRFSSSRIFCFPLFTRHLFVGSHCYGFSSDKRLWLLLPGLGLAACLPLVVDLLLRIPCCSILGSCHSTLVVFVASKFNHSLVRATTGHAHQLGLQVVWPVLCRYSAPIPGRLLLGSYSWTPSCNTRDPSHALQHARW